jgi:hypothetical protein
MKFDPKAVALALNASHRRLLAKAKAETAYA